MGAESRETRLRRVRMRATHRGIREMDVILSRFIAGNLDGMDAAALDRFEALLGENDHDLFAWVAGRRPAPARHAALIAEIAREAGHGDIGV